MPVLTISLVQECLTLYGHHLAFPSLLKLSPPIPISFAQYISSYKDGTPILLTPFFPLNWHMKVYTSAGAQPHATFLPPHSVASFLTEKFSQQHSFFPFLSLYRSFPLVVSYPVPTLLSKKNPNPTNACFFPSPTNNITPSFSSPSASLIFASYATSLN